MVNSTRRPNHRVHRASARPYNSGVSSPPPPAVANPVRVVFFGPPRSGKSKLLDAVVAVARTQADDAVPLVPADSGSVIQAGEVIRRRVSIDLPGPRAVTGDIEFIDCDGRAAQELLADADRLRSAQARSELTSSVRSTDALVVVIDTSSPPEHVDEVFAQLHTFLKVLRDQRTADREVGGLPVFLVLCKCDELARRGEGFTDWQERVQEALKRLEGRFREWFEDGGGPYLAFGSTELSVAATATSWPDVIGGVPDSTNGFGVDELHADLIRAARDHRDRSARSRARLTWTAGIAVGLLSLLLVSLIGLSATREPAAVDALAERVKRMRQALGPPEVRLADERFERNRREVQSAREAPVFDLLPADLQKYVEDELRQFSAYELYRHKFDPPQFSPADVRTSGERAELETALETRLAPPPEFAPEWQRTEAVQLRDKWRGDLRRLTDAERQVHEWYTRQLARLNELQLAAVPSERWSPAGWRAAVGDAVTRQPPYPTEQPLEGSPAVPVPRGEPITWAAAYKFERSAAAADEWRQAAIKLSDVRDLADAVGLTTNPLKPEAVLDLPFPSDPKESLALAADRLAKLRDRFPRAIDGKAGWSVSVIPGPLRDVLGQRLNAAAANGIDQVRRLVAADPAAGGEWAKLAAPNGLLTKPDMAAWGELLRLLIGWADTDRPSEDPVKHLAAFVTTPEFRWQLSKVTLWLPNALRVNAVEKAGDLTIKIGGGDAGRTYTLTAGRPRVEANVTTIEFTPPEEALRYVPGESFVAAVTLTDKDGGYTLRWQDARTPAFRFEALLREPTVETVGPNPVPQRADGVRATVTTREGSEPFRVPLLLPQTK